MPLAPEPLPEINDNQPAPEVTSPNVLSLDTVTNDANKAPEMDLQKIESTIRTDTVDPATQRANNKETTERLSKAEALKKAEKELKDESEKKSKALAEKTDDKEANEDDESGETESDESEKEVVEGEEAEVKQTEEELKLHGNTKRDYSGFNANQVKILKRLDNGRFQAVATEWKALQAAAGKSVELLQELQAQKKIAEGKGIPETWYQHPEAYTLTPEFRQVSTQFSQYDQMEAHYTNQLAAIQDGKPWIAITGIDANGNLVYSQPQEPNAQAAAKVQHALMQATTYKGQLQGKVEQLASNFKQQHEAAATELNNEVKKFIDKLHPEIKPIEADLNNALGSLHPMYRNHPMAKAFAQSVAVNFAQGRYLAKLLAEKEQASKVAADKKLAGPRGSSAMPKASPAASGAKAKGQVFDLKTILGDE